MKQFVATIILLITLGFLLYPKEKQKAKPLFKSGDILNRKSFNPEPWEDKKEIQQIMIIQVGIKKYLYCYVQISCSPEYYRDWDFESIEMLYEKVNK